MFVEPLSEETFRSRWPAYGFELALNVRAQRQARGLSQRQLADLAGLSRNAISNIERNEASPTRASDPSLSTIYRLAAALGVAPALLLPGVDSTMEWVKGGK